MAKIRVSVAEENPQSRWYTTYSGAGALDTAWNSTRIAVTAAKPAERGSRPAVRGRATGGRVSTFESDIE
jgi:hypothetical protein